MTTARFISLALALYAVTAQLTVCAQIATSGPNRVGNCSQNIAGCLRSWDDSVKRCVVSCNSIGFPDSPSVVIIPAGIGISTGPAVGGTNTRVRERLAEIIERGTQADRVQLANRLAAPSIASLFDESPSPTDVQALKPELRDVLRTIKDGSAAERAGIAQKVISPSK